jgi:integrase
MPRRTERLSAGRLNKLPTGMHNDGGGLYLRVSGTAGRSWIFRYRRGTGKGSLHDLGLGSLITIDLARARHEAGKCRLALYDGLDPGTVRKASPRRARQASVATTFRQAAELYIEAHQKGRSEQQWRQSLRDHVHPVFGDAPVATVDTDLVMLAIEPIWKTKTETASRVRGRIEKILDWATTKKYRTGENPARWGGHLEHLLAEKSKVKEIRHHAALAYADTHNLVAQLRRQTSITARALEFAILTAGRTGEIIGARWEEIDFKRRLWAIPGERMKMDRDHRVPLSEPALAILEEMKAIRSSAFVFPGMRPGRPLDGSSLRKFLGQIRPGLTVHGFRSSFTDWCMEKTDFPREVREMALAHKVDDKVEEAYRRGDLFERRIKVMDDWATFCAGTSAPELASAA